MSSTFRNYICSEQSVSTSVSFTGVINKDLMVLKRSVKILHENQSGRNKKVHILIYPSCLAIDLFYSYIKIFFVVVSFQCAKFHSVHFPPDSSIQGVHPHTGFAQLLWERRHCPSDCVHRPKGRLLHCIYGTACMFDLTSCFLITFYLT